VRRRIILIVVSLALAASGTALIFSMAGRGEAAETRVTYSSVLVASERIEPGTTARAAQANIHLADVPVVAIVPGALTSLDEVAALRAVGPIFPGEQVLAAHFGEVSTSPLRPPRGTLGLSVQLGDPQRVAGFVTPGSQVAVFATTDVGTKSSSTRLLLSSVQVLGVGSSTVTTRTTTSKGSPASGETTTEQIPSAILTLALSVRDAERVVFAASQGQLHLGLLAGALRNEPNPGVNTQNLYQGTP